jgi:hypothetical protein
MQGSAKPIAMDEASARRVLLAQAIEANDPQRRLLTDAQREQIDRDSVQAARAAGAADAGDEGLARFLQQRAALVVEAASQRDRTIGSLQQVNSGERWIAGGIPVAALILGVFTDQVANPHQVNLLSRPLLLLLLWNLAVYAALLAGAFWPRGGQLRPPRFAALRQWLAGWRYRERRPRQVGSDVTSAFLARWQAVSGALYGQRLARVMHLAAAAWALGVGLSLVFGGVWASYGVQWESTFLTASDVHAFLSVLFSPVTALFPWASFSLEEVRSLRTAGPLPALPEAGDNFTGRRWVFLYTMLLALLIVLPRLALAALAWWRERRLANAIAIDGSDSYFRRLASLLRPVQVTLGLLVHRAQDRDAMLRVLRAETASDGELLKVAGGETLRLVELPRSIPVSVQVQGPGRRLLGSFLRKPSTLVPDAVREDVDVVVHVIGEAQDAANGAALLQWLDKPVVALPLDQIARCWVQERGLFDAVARELPEDKAAGFAALAHAWDERNQRRLRESMAAIARHLMAAAGQTEEVGKAPRSLISLVSPAERDAHERRSREAMAAVLERLRRSDSEAMTSLLVLHGAQPSVAGALNHRLEEKFVVQQAISAGQAGVAGAATGAAMGVSIDLLTAGLSLGLGALAGAVVGGGAAWVAAVWKNQATPAGTSVVQLSDDMLQAMAEAGLLRYLAVIHLGRGTDAIGAAGEIRPEWRSEVVAAVEARSADLKEQWAAARARQEALDPSAALAAMLESIALAVLRRLYP